MKPSTVMALHHSTKSKVEDCYDRYYVVGMRPETLDKGMEMVMAKILVQVSMGLMLMGVQVQHCALVHPDIFFPLCDTRICIKSVWLLI